MFKELHEECGLIGIYDNDGLDCAYLTYMGLYALQHRGQESCGIAVSKDREIKFYKDQGHVREVFRADILRQLQGQIAVGHVRYGTGSVSGAIDAQPLVTTYRKGPLAIAHNGSLANARALRDMVESQGGFLQTTTDGEIILQMITRERSMMREGTLEDAVARVIPQLEGAYSVILMNGTKLIAFRDPNGIRPLCLGKIDGSWVVASETCALDTVGASFVRDIEPGEILVIDAEGLHSNRAFCGGKSSLCIFEYIYFARTDSIIDGQSVYDARREAGRILARSYPVEADLVVGVPDSGIDAAAGYAEESGIPNGRGLVINRYVGRTFINPGQENRAAAVRIKLNAMRSAVAGKRIVVVDDSIVRGTTTENLVRLLKDAGAAEVHMRISSPPFLHPCYYGTDVPDEDQLVANNLSIEDICKRTNADSLGYLPLDKVHMIAPNAQCGFCKACFSGEYPTPVERGE